MLTAVSSTEVIVNAVVALACIIIRGVSALLVYLNRDNK